MKVIKSGLIINMVAGLQDWNCRVNSSMDRVPETAKVARNIIIGNLWMLTQE